MRPCFSICLLFTFCRLVSAQEQSLTAVNITAVEGDGAINSIRLHRAHEPIVRVLDSSGEPLSDATVTFLLPATGPSGTFPDGGLSLVTQTDGEGRAAGRGLRPNTVAGKFQIRVTASWRGAVGAAMLVQTNAEPVVKSHTKTIVILVAVAGAAAGGVVAATHGKSSAASTSSTSTTITGGTISPGSPTFGPPH